MEKVAWLSLQCMELCTIYQSVLQKNDKGSWYGWSVTQDRIMGQEDKSLYLVSAKDFNSSVAKGNVQTKADVEEKAKDNTPY